MQKAGDYQEETLDKERGGFDTSSTLKHDDGSMPAPHPSKLAAEKGSSYMLSHPVYDKAYLRSIVPRHRPPETVREWVGGMATCTITPATSTRRKALPRPAGNACTTALHRTR